MSQAGRQLSGRSVVSRLADELLDAESVGVGANEARFQVRRERARELRALRLVVLPAFIARLAAHRLGVRCGRGGQWARAQDGNPAARSFQALYMLQSSSSNGG